MHPLEEIRSRLWEFVVRRHADGWELLDGRRTLSDGELTRTVRVTGDERPRTRADTLEALLAATPDRRGEVGVGAPRVRREVLSVAAKPGDGAPITRFELALQRADHGAVAVVIDLAEPLELVVERHQSDGSRTWTWEPAVLWAPALGTLGVTDPGRAFARVAEQKRWHDGGWVWNTIVVASAQADRPNLAAADMTRRGRAGVYEHLSRLWRLAEHSLDEVLTVHVRPAPPIDELLDDLDHRLGPDGELSLSTRTGSFTNNEYLVGHPPGAWWATRHAEDLSLELALSSALELTT